MNQISSVWRSFVKWGAILFICALIISAWVVPELRMLHFLQAFIYILIIILTGRNNTFGYGAGATIGVLWNSINLFVTQLMQEGAMLIWSLARTGQLKRLDTIMVALGGAAHFIIIIGCVMATVRSGMVDKKWQKFFVGGAVAFLYLVLIVAIARPR
jgi:hypothetical protein